MNFWGCLVFSRENRRLKTAKFKIYLNFEDCKASVVALSLGRWWCPPSAGGQGAAASGVLRCVPSLSPCLLSALLLCLWCVSPERGSISRFKAVLEGLWCRCMFVRLLVLCVACAAFVRVYS